MTWSSTKRIVVAISAPLSIYRHFDTNQRTHALLALDRETSADHASSLLHTEQPKTGSHAALLDETSPLVTHLPKHRRALDPQSNANRVGPGVAKGIRYR